MPAPRYPADAVTKKISGKVVLLVDVAADGSVKNVKVETSEPAGVFDQAALDAAKDWTFNPSDQGRQAGRWTRAGADHVRCECCEGQKQPMKVPATGTPILPHMTGSSTTSTVDKDIRAMNCDVLTMDPQSTCVVLRSAQADCEPS